MKSKLLEFIDFEKVNSLLEGFNKATGFVTAILDLDGNILSKSGWRQICTEFHRVHPESAHNCRISDTNLANSTLHDHKVHYYQCLNGLIDVAVPLVIHEEHIANLFTGQFFFEKPDTDLFKQQAERYGFDETAYLDALSKTPIVSKEKVQMVVDFLLNMTQLIAEMTLQKLEQENLNDKLKESENQYRNLANAGMALIWTSGTDKLCNYFNEPWLAFTGRTLEQEMGNGWAEGVHPDDFDKCLATYVQAFDKREAFEMEYRLRHASGEYRVILDLGKPSFNSKGVFIGYIGHCFDITERKKESLALAESEENLAITLRAIGDGVISTDLNGFIVEMNPIAEKLCGWNYNEAIGKPLSEVFRIVNSETRNSVSNPVQEVLKTGRIVGLANHTLLIAKDGKEYHISDSAAPIKNNEGEIIGVVLVFSDATEKITAEKALKASEERFRIAQEMSPDGFTILQPVKNKEGEIIDFVWLYENQTIARINGTDPQQVIGKQVLDLFPSHRDTPVFETYLQVAKTGKTQILEEVYVGMILSKPTWLRLVVVSMGEDIAILGQDITDRKFAEAALRESEERFKALHNASFGGITIHDKGIILECNQGLSEITGYSLNELIGMNGLLLIAPESREIVMDHILAGYEKPYEALGLRKNGEVYPIRLEARNVPYKGRIARTVEFRDITEIKQAEKALEKEKAWSENIVKSAPNIIVGLGERSIIKVFNHYAERLTGYKAEEVLGKEWINIFIPVELKETIYKTWEDIVRNKLIDHHFENEIITKAGEKRLISWSNTILNDNEEFRMILSIGTDITKRKQAEEELEHSKRSFEAIYNSTTDCIFIHDGDTGKIIDVNQATIDTYGYSKDELKELNIGDLSLNEAPYTQKDAVALLEKAAKEGVQFFEWRSKKKTGELMWLEISLQHVELAGVRRVLVVGRDITERKLVEEALRKSEKHNAFLAQTAFDLVKLNSLQEIYSYVVQKLHELFEGNSIVALVENNHQEKRWRLQQIKGVGTKTVELSKLLGFDIDKLEGDISTKYYEQIKSGRLTELDFDFPGLFNNKLSAAIGSTVKRMFSIDKMYSIGFQQDDVIIGNITFTTTNKSEPINANLIESFVQQVSNFVRKQIAEEKSKEKDLQFRKLSANLPDLMYQFTRRADGSYFVPIASEGIINIFGCQPEDVAENFEAIARVLHPDDAERVIREIEYSAKHLSYFSTEFRVLIPGKPVQWILSRSTPEKLNDGSITWYGFNANITDKKSAEDALLESEARFRMLSSFTFEGIIIHNNDIAVDVNRSAVELLGYERDEIIGMNLFELIHPDYHETAKANLAQKIAKPYQIIGIRKDGSTFDAEIEARNIAYNEKYFRVVCVRNITDRKRAERIRLLQYNIARSILSIRNLNELYEFIKMELHSIVDSENLFIALYNEETGMLSANVDRDEKGEIPEWPAEKSLTGYLIEQNHPMLLQKDEILELHKAGMIELYGTISEAWLGAPLKVDGKTVGAVVVQNYSNPDAYDQTSLEIMELVANELSIFIDRQRSEEKSNKLSRAVEQSSVSVIITNRDGAIEYINPFFSEISGYRFDEVKGNNPSILKSGHQSNEFYKELWDTINAGNNWEGELLNKKKTGELYWERAVISPVFSSDGMITNFVAIKEDVTEKKLTEEKLLEAHRISKLGTYELDLKQLIFHVSANMSDIYGFTDKLSFSFEEWQSSLHPDEKSRLKSALDKVLEGNQQEIDVEFRIIRKKDQELRWIHAVGKLSYNEDGEAIRLVGTSKDITDIKNYEQKLIEAKEIAEENNRLKTAFLQNLSHEVRTPLNGIIGFSELINDPDLSADDRKRFTDIIIERGWQLTSIINDILTVSAIETGQEKPFIEKTNIHQLINNHLEVYKPKVEQNGLKLRSNILLDHEKFEILADKPKIGQILNNLFNNAIKFTGSGYIELGCSIKQNMLEFYVKDTGIGIDKRKQSRIFERFAQADDSIRMDYGGTGLGLSICKGFVEMMGGNIWVNSAPYAGSTFYFTIPLIPVETDTNSVSAVKKPVASSKKYKALVAEDDENNFFVIAFMLESVNIQVLHAKNGKEAYDMAQNESVDLVFMDIKMPILDGYAAALLIREIKPDLPIIAQTAHAAPSEIRQYGDAFDAYLTKPFTREKITKQLQQLGFFTE